ncbi:MAG: hypothetical protein CEN92_232 [Candidatus Berkelbacteria bacterium Licking1014_96]|uniref:GHMP kinase N-terminal domain-containing protein n=1 Tax=Candidatus Berkelbacteria bacterium Licking1014_96 TaxID=2017149 RepID=A0A554LFS1_9BACT|nr:MAG: hypothetical protein CEN92_232 [Candidatus Berkelbacteria bacterium Licking1014_96]
MEGNKVIFASREDLKFRFFRVVEKTHHNNTREDNVSVDLLMGSLPMSMEEEMAREAHGLLMLTSQSRWLDPATESIIVSRAPVRMDFGGWPDTQFFLKYDWGYLMNIALRLWTYVVIVQSRRPGGYVYHALDFKEQIHEREETFVHQALEELRSQLSTRERSIIIHSLAPPQTGLGTSGSVGVAVVAALNAVKCGKTMTVEEIVYLAHMIEWLRMESETGIQDQIAAGDGSSVIRCLARKFPQSRWRRLRFLPGMRQRTESSSFLIDTAEVRSSDEEHRRKIRMVERGGSARRNVLDSIRQIRRWGMRAAKSFESGSFEDFCTCVGKIWQAQVQLDPSARTERIMKLEEAAKEMEAVVKWLGAAGGGMGVVLCPRGAGQRREVETELEKLVQTMSGARIIPCLVATTGVEVCSFTPEELEEVITRR